ncbi:hypothetical protein Q3C01_33200 [Bradyrhizobium sp. UFLA05-109]
MSFSTSHFLRCGGSLRLARPERASELTEDFEKWSRIMFYRLSGVALATLILGTIDVVAADLPVYEIAGLPITPHQLMVLGPAGAEQDYSPFIQTMAGMPASPHQIAVLTPRPAQIGQQAYNKR